MEILQTFGFEPILFAAQIINFLILAFVFKKFLYKPILKTLKERRLIIAKGLEDAKSAEEKLANAGTEKDIILKQAGKEAGKMITETQITAEELKNKILSQAKKDAERIIEEAKTQADLQMENMEKRAKAASLDNSMTILSKVLEKLFTKDEKEKIVTRSMKVLKEEKS